MRRANGSFALVGENEGPTIGPERPRVSGRKVQEPSVVNCGGSYLWILFRGSLIMVKEIGFRKPVGDGNIELRRKPAPRHDVLSPGGEARDEHVGPVEPVPLWSPSLLELRPHRALRRPNRNGAW